MKRLFLAIGLAAFMMTSCGGSQENKENKEAKCEEQTVQCDSVKKCHEMTAEDRAEIEGIIDIMMNWENASDSLKAAGIAMAKARVEKCEAKRAEMKAACDSLAPKCEGHKCEGNHEGCNHDSIAPKCGEQHRCEGMMTKEECEAKWAAFDSLTMDEQKAVLCCKLHHCKGFRMVMHEKFAPKHECEGNHEGCEHQCNHDEVK